jgi:hypothetical protein
MKPSSQPGILRLVRAVRSWFGLDQPLNHWLVTAALWTPPLVVALVASSIPDINVLLQLLVGAGAYLVTAVIWFPIILRLPAYQRALKRVADDPGSS